MGRNVAQCFLRDVLIVDLKGTLKNSRCLCRTRKPRYVRVRNSMIIKVFGLWRSWFGQAMFDAVGGADAIKRVGTRGLALAGGAEMIGKFLTIPLSVRTLVIVKGALSIRRVRKPPAEAADLSWRSSA